MGTLTNDPTTSPAWQSAYAAGCDARDNGMSYSVALINAQARGNLQYAYMEGWRDAGIVAVDE